MELPTRHVCSLRSQTRHPSRGARLRALGGWKKKRVAEKNFTLTKILFTKFVNPAFTTFVEPAFTKGFE
ncbi:MAG: hypothetical protein ABW213_02825 [Tardiphaga sp.]